MNGEKSAVSLSGWKPVGLFAFGIFASSKRVLEIVKGEGMGSWLPQKILNSYMVAAQGLLCT